jgi:hypothetical protein
VLVGDTGFEPVTSSVSGQNRCLGMGMSVASGECGGSLMFATVCAGWPTVWPTASRLTSAGFTAAPASCLSWPQIARTGAQLGGGDVHASRAGKYGSAGPPLQLGPAAMWTSRSPTRDRVCQTGQ